MTYRISFFHLAIPYRMNAYYPDDFKLQSEFAILAIHSSPFHKVLGKQTPPALCRKVFDKSLKYFPF